MGEFTLTIPDEVYQRAQEIAEETHQPVEHVLLTHLRTLPDPLLRLPYDEQAELIALRQLSNDALYAIAREQMASDIQARMQVLMDKHSSGNITPVELKELEAAVERGNRLMIRKAEAAGILMDRGLPFSQDRFLST